MFPFKCLKRVHLEISNNCQASCPMCARNIQGGLDNPLIKLTDWSLDDYKQIMSSTVLNQIEGMYFCGNFGDPIMNNDLMDMCRYTRDTNPAVRIAIHTNGSARSVQWWRDLVDALPENHRVVFALDGMGDTHSLYRIGTNFDMILRNATAFINAGGKAEWTFIRFKHNEHQVEEAEAMAKTLGFETFVVKNSSRFLLEPKIQVLDKKGSTTHIIEPSTTVKMKFIDKKVIESYKEIIESTEIDCLALDLKEIYIDAYGDVFPCCWLASIPYTAVEDTKVLYDVRLEIINQYKSLVHSLGGKEKINAFTNKVEDIIDSKEYQTVWDHYWKVDKLITCGRTCGTGKKVTFSQPRDQFEETKIL